MRAPEQSEVDGIAGPGFRLKSNYILSVFSLQNSFVNSLIVLLENTEGQREQLFLNEQSPSETVAQIHPKRIEIELDEEQRQRWRIENVTIVNDSSETR